MKAKGHVPLRPGRSIKLPTGRSNRSWSWGTWHYCHVHKPNTCFLKANGTWGKPIEYSRAPRGSRQRSVWQRERFQHSTTDSIGKEEIKSLFQQEIADNVLIVLKDVRPKLSTSLTLRKLMPYKEMVRRVADCVRYFQTKEPRKEPEELPESGKPSLTSTWVASSTETLSSQKCAWSNEDAAIIKKYFVTPKKAISIHEVRKMFQEIEELRNLLKEKRLQQCVDKTKNMRKEKGKWTTPVQPSSCALVTAMRNFMSCTYTLYYRRKRLLKIENKS